MRAGGTGLDANVDVARYFAGTHFEMDGPATLRITARHLPDLLDRLLARAGVCLEQIDLVVPHQASAHGIEHMRRRLVSRVTSWSTSSPRMATRCPPAADGA